MKGMGLISDVVMSNFAGQLKDKISSDPLSSAMSASQSVHYVGCPGGGCGNW